MEFGNRIERYFVDHAALALISGALAQVQPAATSKTPAVEEKLAQSYRAMYDLKFQDAFKAADEAKAVAQDDPLPSVAQPGSLSSVNLTGCMRSAVKFSPPMMASIPANPMPGSLPTKQSLTLPWTAPKSWRRTGSNKNPNDPRALLALSLTNGLRGDDMGLFTKKDLKALSYIKSATTYGEKLLVIAPDSYDAYVATGLGKYIIGRKSAPVRWVLRMGGYKGDELEGVKELALAADHARYLAPFARILVAFEDVRRNNTTEARKRLEDSASAVPQQSHVHGRVEQAEPHFSATPSRQRKQARQLVRQSNGSRAQNLSAALFLYKHHHPDIRALPFFCHRERHACFKAARMQAAQLPQFTHNRRMMQCAPAVLARAYLGCQIVFRKRQHLPSHHWLKRALLRGWQSCSRQPSQSSLPPVPAYPQPG